MEKSQLNSNYRKNIYILAPDCWETFCKKKKKRKKRRKKQIHKLNSFMKTTKGQTLRGKSPKNFMSISLGVFIVCQKFRSG